MPDLSHRISIDTTPEEVYAAVATEKGMRGWWTADTQMQEKVGGTTPAAMRKAEVGLFAIGLDFPFQLCSLPLRVVAAARHTHEFCRFEGVNAHVEDGASIVKRLRPMRLPAIRPGEN